MIHWSFLNGLFLSWPNAWSTMAILSRNPSTALSFWFYHLRCLVCFCLVVSHGWRSLVLLCSDLRTDRFTLLCRRLTSVAASPHLVMRVVASLTKQQISPGNAHWPPHLSLLHIRQLLPCIYWTLKICGFSSDVDASYVVLVHQGSGLLIDFL